MPVRRSVMGWWIAVTAPLWSAGCLDYCLVQGRGITLYALADGGDVVGASPDSQSQLSSVGFVEFRGQGQDDRSVHWGIRAPARGLQGRVTAVHLHDGDGTVLYTFPSGTSPGSTMVTEGAFDARDDGTFAREYRGTVPMEEIMRRMYRGPTYIDVHTDLFPAGEIFAPLGTPRWLHPPVEPTEWRDECT